MRISSPFAVVVCVAAVLTASPAAAQYSQRPSSDRATGENYHVEVGGFLWSPTPDVAITSESLGIIGSKIDFVQDLGIEKETFKQLKVVLRPSTKSKFRLEYTPITYTARATLTRSIVFNGILFPLSVPIDSELKWKAYRFGYEYDFIYRDRGFIGLVLEAKYTDVQATLTNAALGITEFVRARAPIPSIGLIGRAYPIPNISITGEFTFIKVPDSIDENYSANYYDFDIYATVNFTDHFGAQGGYRSFDVFYHIDDDEGTLKLKGLYFGGVVRF